MPRPPPDVVRHLPHILGARLNIRYDCVRRIAPSSVDGNRNQSQIRGIQLHSKAAWVFEAQVLEMS